MCAIIDTHALHTSETILWLSMAMNFHLWLAIRKNGQSYISYPFLATSFQIKLYKAMLVQRWKRISFFTRSYTGSQYIESIKIKKHKAQRKMRNKNKSKQIWALWYTEQISEHIMESYGSTARIIIHWSSNTTKTRR